MMITITKKVYADFKNIKIYRLYSRDNTKQVRMSYFHCGPFRKSKKKKEKKDQMVARTSLDRVQKEKYSKKEKETSMMTITMILLVSNGNNNDDKNNK